MNIEIRPTQYLTITGILYPDNRLLLQPGYLTERSEYAIEDPSSTLIAELIDDSGKVILRYHVPVGPFCTPGGNIKEMAVIAKIPFPESTQAIRFYRDGLLIHELTVPKGKPVVRIDWEPPALVKGRHTVTWTGEHTEGKPLHYILCYSHTNGESLQPLSLSTEETKQEVDFDGLPGGDKCRVAVIATDGVNTIKVESKSFSVPVKPYRAMILSPEDGATFASNEPVTLQGQGFYLEENQAETEALVWTSSKDGELGKGMIVEIPKLSPGSHYITLTAGTGERAGKATISIHVGKDIPQNI